MATSKRTIADASQLSLLGSRHRRRRAERAPSRRRTLPVRSRGRPPAHRAVEQPAGSGRTHGRPRRVEPCRERECGRRNRAHADGCSARLDRRRQRFVRQERASRLSVRGGLVESNPVGVADDLVGVDQRRSVRPHPRLATRLARRRCDDVDDAVARAAARCSRRARQSVRRRRAAVVSCTAPRSGQLVRLERRRSGSHRRRRVRSTPAVRRRSRVGADGATCASSRRRRSRSRDHRSDAGVETRHGSAPSRSASCSARFEVDPVDRSPWLDRERRARCSSRVSPRLVARCSDRPAIRADRSSPRAQAVRWRTGALVVEQPGLGLDAAAEAGEVAVGADHPVARDDDRQRVAAVGGADGAGLVGGRRAGGPARRS